EVAEQFVLLEADVAAMGEKQDGEEGFDARAARRVDLGIQHLLAPGVVLFAEYPLNIGDDGLDVLAVGSARHVGLGRFVVDPEVVARAVVERLRSSLEPLWRATGVVGSRLLPPRV